MDNGRNIFDVRKGAEVIGSDGDKLGKVDAVNGDMFTVRKGFFFPQDHQIPMSAVSSADEDNVYLSVTGDAALAGEWGTPVATDMSVNADDVSNTGTTNLGGGLNVDPEPFEHEQDTQKTHYNEQDDLVVPVSEEELVAGTRPVERGEVRVNKRVVEEEQSLDVPVTEEEVEVTRRRVDREATAGDDAFEEGTIEVPLQGEEVDVEKRNRVVEEVDIDKTARTRNQRVSDTVRREEVDVDGENVDIERQTRDRLDDAGTRGN